MFAEHLMDHFRAIGWEIKTAPSYLLHSKDHPIELPYEIGGIPVEMHFEAVLPHWLDNPRAKFFVRVDSGRRHYWVETKDYEMPVRRIVFRCITDLHLALEARKEAEEIARKHRAADVAFDKLSVTTGISPSEENPNVLKKNNVKILKCPDTPTQVIVMVSVSHDKAAEIASSYGRL